MLQTPNLNIADTDLLNVFRHMSLPFAVAVPALRYSALVTVHGSTGNIRACMVVGKP
jgi:hypothetical protein